MGSVVVVGSVNVDLIVRLARIPGPGETVAGGTFHRAPGGKGGNQATAAARLGASTSFVGMVGRDELGERAREDLRDEGVDVTHLGESDAPTGVAAILVDEEGRNVIGVASGANAELTAGQVTASLDVLAPGRPVILANLEIPDEALVAAGESALGHDLTFVLNPAPARRVPRSVMESASVVVPNEGEAEALGGLGGLRGAGADAVVVTRGADGADLHLPDAPAAHQEAARVEVVDTTGAGDAFCGALAWALADGRDLPEAVRLASVAGALACRTVGARSAMPTRAELDELAAGGV